MLPMFWTVPATPSEALLLTCSVAEPLPILSEATLTGESMLSSITVAPLTEILTSELVLGTPLSQFSLAPQTPDPNMGPVQSSSLEGGVDGVTLIARLSGVLSKAPSLASKVRLSVPVKPLL